MSAALQVAWCCAQTGAALIAGAAHLCCCARGARASSDVVWSAPAQFVASRSRPEQRSVHTAHPALLAGANALSISQCQGEPVHRRVKARSVVRQGHSRAHADKRRRRIIQHPPHACSPVAQMPKHFDKRALTRCGYRENPTARILAAMRVRICCAFAYTAPHRPHFAHSFHVHALARANRLSSLQKHTPAHFLSAPPALHH